MSSTRNDGPPPVPGQAPTKVDGSVPFDLEEATDEAAAARSAEESASEVVQISTPAAPSTRRIYATEDSGLDLTGEGYDSDGNPPPFSSSFDKHHQEAAVNDFDANEEIFDDANDGSADNMFVLLENEEIKKLKVDELRAELIKRGLSKNGLKLDLQERLSKAMDDGVLCIKTTTTAAAPTGFHKNARWHFIDSKDLPDLPDPVNEGFETAYAPSDRQGPAGARKFNYHKAW